ncbi:uncharacterized protein LOC115664710 [Syzygium oleosum]|uniref:uncharacterized protein LOC115664710 n=1 Tax=Syzygium oleosum TaxID=219896 RepID=UPI0024B87D53|nr:uncharacterized protein LOC115664710 [Syzygium oleosum]XP_056170294.1 uncharacterized protein LOC115664710 [Syzygium oleosum]XP_056170295.1 uncharacterized protein LOC115664710 [Syzygium oleosum]XP_056170296.1 uncharacterized protein LOC115664710 [Syzygium oleosum]
MNGFQNRRVHNFEKQSPRCLGRMVNLFDLSAGVTSSRLLADRPHPYGSSLSRSLSDMATMLAPTFGNQTEEKRIVVNSRRISSSRTSMGTPMKMLIAEEMSKEVESKRRPPNVIAKLMGLDALPQQQPHSVSRRSQSEGSLQHRLENLEIAAEYWQRERGFLDKQMQREVLKYEENDYKDFYESSPQSKKKFVSGKQQQKGRYTDRTNEKKMALVRQKFREAKRLATDENLRQSKEFHDALEVLSSNKELFLKFLQEPNSMFSKHLYELQHISMPLETKRITILRPSKMVDDHKFSIPGRRNENLTKTPTLIPDHGGWDKNKSSYSSTYSCQNVNECQSQPTRIVVLKPSAVMAHDLKAVVSPTSGSQRILSDENTTEEAEDDGVRESGEVAKELPGQMHENLAGHRRDETLLSSVLSNGYIGDDSSFNKSENEYAVGNLSDSEVMSPASRHSWDYINRVGSPYSISSFSRASYSPESSVCREAKKRLSERWAMMTSNQNSQDQRYVRKGSSTLGEMLALSDTKKSVRSEEDGNKKEQEQVGSSSSLGKEESVVASPKNLSRSKSVPVSSTLYDIKLSPEAPDSQAGKSNVPKQPIKKSVGSSLKGKVSSLFFSKNKKSSKGKPNVSRSKDEGQCPDAETPPYSTYQHEQINVDSSECVEGKISEECSSPRQHGSVSKTSLGSVDIAQEQGVYAQEGSMPVALGNLNCSQEQPSPISVLEPSFEEDDNPTPESFGKQPLGHSLKSNLIDKSPPIESIARTLSWDDSCFETSPSYQRRSPMVCSSAEEEELDWPVFVTTVLSAAGFDSEVQPDTFFSRWHSPESPLDPSLREKFANTKDVKEPMPEAKRRQRRSERKLVFDCVNAALVEITGCGPSLGPIDCKAPNGMLEQTLSITVDHVWARVTEWFPDEVRCVSSGDGGSNSLVVERVVRNEVVGKGWMEQLSLEMHSVSKEIEWKLLDELVDEAVVDLTGGLS